MRTTVELSDRTYRRLRAEAAERGTRGFSSIVEEAVERLLDRRVEDETLSAALVEAEGAWSDDDFADWERAREEAWATWQVHRPSTPTS